MAAPASFSFPALVGFLVWLGTIAGFAQPGALLSLKGENDFVVGEDRHYTHGAKLTYYSPDHDPNQPLPPAVSWSRFLPSVGLDPRALKWGLAFGQELYTPDDLRTPELIPDDRPYAAWLYGSMAWQRRGLAWGNVPALEEFRLDLGLVGPPAQGEETQNLAHHKDPEGWDNQVDTEPGLALRYDRQYQFSISGPDFRWRCDLIPRFGGSAGNIDTHLGAGGILRAGFNVPDDFTAEARHEPARWGLYLFGSVEGRWVIHNLFLDGNTFHSSHSVDKEPLVAEYRMGLSVLLGKLELSYSHAFRSEEFKKQQNADNFGSVTCTYRF